MNLDLPTVAGVVAVVVALLILIGVALWAALHKRTPAAPPVQYETRPFSLSRAMDDAKHEHADRIITQALGVSHAVNVGRILGTLDVPKPPEAPKA